MCGVGGRADPTAGTDDSRIITACLVEQGEHAKGTLGQPICSSHLQQGLAAGLFVGRSDDGPRATAARQALSLNLGKALIALEAFACSQARQQHTHPACDTRGAARPAVESASRQDPCVVASCAHQAWVCIESTQCLWPDQNRGLKSADAEVANSRAVKVAHATKLHPPQPATVRPHANKPTVGWCSTLDPG